MNNSNENKRPALTDGKVDEKRARINRIVYITAIILLVSVAIIAGVVSAANKAKKDPLKTPAQSGLSSSTPGGTGNTSRPSSRPESSGTLQSDSVVSRPDTDVSSRIPDFVLPVSGVLSVDHDPEIQVFSPTMKDYRVHLGVDINTAPGASVLSAAEGVVEKVWEDPMMGWCVSVAHDGDSTTCYKNLGELLAEGIKVGAVVDRGDVIGVVGDSAMMEIAQEPHLHFEMTVGGQQVDPSDYFSSKVWKELEADSSYEG